MIEGDMVVPCGRLETVVNFLASADKETIRLLASFFTEDARGTADAKRLKKPCLVVKVHKDSLEVKLSKGYIWEEKYDYFKSSKEKEDVIEQKEAKPTLHT